MDTLWSERVPLQTLTKRSGCLPLCVKIPVSISQSRVCLTSGIWLSFERLLMFCDDLPRPCSLVCCVLLLGMIPIRWWFMPRFAPGKRFFLSAIVSLRHFWCLFSVCGMSGRLYWPDGGSHCRVRFCGVFCKNIISPFWRMHVRFPPPFVVVDYSQDCMPKKNAPVVSWPMAMLRCVFVYL